MRTETRKSYEKHIDRLEKALEDSEDRSSRWRTWHGIAQGNYDRLLKARRQGERDRSWAIEQALMTNRPDIVKTARQIADYVFGPDIEADREAEQA